MRVSILAPYVAWLPEIFCLRRIFVEVGVDSLARKGGTTTMDYKDIPTRPLQFKYILAFMG